MAGAGSIKIAADTVIDVQQIAAREQCSVRKVNMTISLAFLAPGLVKAAIEGRLPRGMGLPVLRCSGRVVASVLEASAVPEARYWRVDFEARDLAARPSRMQCR